MNKLFVDLTTVYLALLSGTHRSALKRMESGLKGKKMPKALPFTLTD